MSGGVGRGGHVGWPARAGSQDRQVLRACVPHSRIRFWSVVCLLGEQGFLPKARSTFPEVCIVVLSTICLLYFLFPNFRVLRLGLILPCTRMLPQFPETGRNRLVGRSMRDTPLRVVVIGHLAKIVKDGVSRVRAPGDRLTDAQCERQKNSECKSDVLGWGRGRIRSRPSSQCTTKSSGRVHRSAARALAFAVVTLGTHYSPRHGKFRSLFCF